MKTFTTIVATLTFLVTPLIPLAVAHGKPLPPAFGKELVPDGQAQGGNDPKAEEIEEMHDKEDEKPARPRGRFCGMRGGPARRERSGARLQRQRHARALVGRAVDFEFAA